MATKNKKRPSSRKPSTPIVNDFVELGKGTISMRLVSDPALVQPRLDALEQQVGDLMSVTGGLWRMIDGTLMAIRQMSDNHLANALSLAKRTGQTTTVENMEREQRRRAKDREFAKTDGKVSSNDDANTLSERIEILNTEIETLRKAKSDVASGRDMALMQGRIDVIEGALNTPVWDGKQQRNVTLVEQVQRLTRRIFDMEQENKKLRAATAVGECKMSFAEGEQAYGRQPTMQQVKDLVQCLKEEVKLPERARLKAWPVGSRGFRVQTLVQALGDLVEGL